MTGLKIRNKKNQYLFNGTVDVQREISCGSGNFLRLTCRSLAGLLLDSEAIPQSYDFPSLPVIFERHIRPYGFSGYLGGKQIFTGPLRIVKGMSEWLAVSMFCKNFLRVTPRIRGDVFDASGQANSQFLLFDNIHGTQYFYAEVKNRCCDRISELFAPSDNTGAYLSVAKDATTSALGITRNRCLSKILENPESLLKAADKKSFAVLVECPGLPAAEIGVSAALNDPLLGEYTGLTVSEIRCTANANGIQTRYVLRRN